MKKEVLVEVKSVSKKFCKDLKRSLLYGVKDLTSDFFGNNQDKTKLRYQEFWAVKDVSFELRRGESLGLIGQNGAGKSTLLKMLNGLIRPDEGEIRMRGRVGALIELGAGFNPILTGRENVYINGQVLGFSKKEIDEKFDAILAFSEIGEFIDTPVQNYSSGMKVRLGFAVAAQMEPDVLILDEVLAVGDAAFRAKCNRRLAEILKNGTSVLFVSHNLPDIQRICSKCIWLSGGKLEMQGDTNEVADAYKIWTDSQGANKQSPNFEEGPSNYLPSAKIKRVITLDTNLNRRTHFFHGEELRVRIQYELTEKLTFLNASVSFTTSEEALYNGYVVSDDGLIVEPNNKAGYIDLIFPYLCLGPGTYWLNVSLKDKENWGIYDWKWSICSITVESSKRLVGKFAMPHNWFFKNLNEIDLLENENNETSI